MAKFMDRREFLKSIGATAAGVSLTQVYNPLVAKALAEIVQTAPPVIWFAGGTCGGCSISALNAMDPKIDEILLKMITLHYHINISASSGDTLMEHVYKVMEEHKGKYIYVQEGVISTAAEGRFCVVGEYKGNKIAMAHLAKELAQNAQAVVAVGSCSAFGGIPSAPPNPTGVKPLSEVVDKPVINVPGCPAHPDDVFGTLIYYLKNGLPELDQHNRPKLFFGEEIHQKCYLKPQFDAENMAENFGEQGKCYAMLGCLGPKTHCNSWKRGWNGNINWCVKSGSHCIACTEPTFAKTKAGMYAY